MTLTLEDIAKAVGLILVLIGIYAAWRTRVQKEVNNERDIKDIKERQDRDKAEMLREIMNNREEIRSLKEYYKELSERLFDALFPKRK